MPNWSNSMQQTYEYYTVDPGTWCDDQRIDNVKSCTIVRDINDDTLGYATLTTSEDIGECYFRVYLVTIQNGIRERFPLGTFLSQTPGYGYNGKSKNIEIDAYTPLIELSEKKPPIGYYIRKNRNITDAVRDLICDNVRVPVTYSKNSSVTPYNFTAEPDETWLDYLRSLLALADMEFDLDEKSNIIFTPKQDINSLQYIWEFNDDNSSILYPDIDLSRDLYGVPNVVELVYSDDNKTIIGTAKNNSSHSPVSIPSRGREIVYRETDPDVSGTPSKTLLNEKAKKLLQELASIEYTLSYTHGYCPVRPRDCVQLNYEKAGLKRVKAMITRQSIKCIPGCPVEETAVYSKDLWGDGDDAI